MVVVSLFSGLLVGALGLTYKLVSIRRCDADNFRLMYSWLAALLVLIAALFRGESLSNPTVVFWGGLAGAAFLLALIALMKAMELGSVAFTWILVNFSIVIPILASSTLWSEPVLPGQWLGLGLFMVCVAFFGWGMRSRDTQSKGITIRWLIFLMLMFLSNGTSLLLLKTISKKSGSHDFFLPFIPYYAIATIGFLAIARVRRAKLPGFGDVKFGLLAAVSATLGNVLLYVALSMNAASALPIVHGGSIIVVSTGSVMFFGESFSWPKAIGTLLGLASITLLAST